jgi:hypothetical protein
MSNMPTQVRSFSGFLQSVFTSILVGSSSRSSQNLSRAVLFYMTYRISGWLQTFDVVMIVMLSNYQRSARELEESLSTRKHAIDERF